MNADLELYRIFCEVVKYKNITKTAEKLFLSQSAITQSIQKLESILGGKLFYRNRKGVELTEEGCNLYEYIKDSIETMSNAENLFSKYVTLESGKVRIGGGNAIVKNVIYEPLKNFCYLYPKIDILITNGTTDDMLKKLVNGDLDVVVFDNRINNNEYNNLEILNVKNTTFVFAATKEYIENNNIKSIKNNTESRFIVPKLSSSRGKIFKKYCAENDICFEKNYEVSSTTIVKSMILDGLGIGYIDIHEIDDIKDKIEILEVVEYKDVVQSVATLKKNMMNKATIEFINEVKEYYEIEEN